MAEIIGTAGADQLNGTWSADDIQGLGEDDHIYGHGGGDTIDGGEGNDHLHAGTGVDGSDRVEGGDGDDYVTIGPDDFADGGAGTDLLGITLSSTDIGSTLDLSNLWNGGTALNGSGTVTGFEGLFYLQGSTGADTIILGTGGIDPSPDGPPWVLGWGGDDRVTGGGQDDWLMGGDGSDALIGLGEDDYLYGDIGDDRLEGGEGDDRLVGGSGSNVLIGGPGSDTYLYYRDVGYDPGVPGADAIVEEAGASGTDKLYFRAEEQIGDAAFAGVANVEVAELVSIQNPAGAEFVLGAEFDATGITSLIASADIDASQTASGLEIWFKPPNRPNLSVVGGSGDDVFHLGHASLPWNIEAYVLDAGPGTDTFLFSSSSEVWRLLHVAPSHSHVHLIGFEAIAVAAGQQAVAVADAPDHFGFIQSFYLSPADWIIPAATRLTIDGTALRTDIVVGLGADSELGGTGDDADVIEADRLVVDASGLTGGRSVQVLGGATDDEVTGTEAGDELNGGGGADQLNGGEGDDLLDGGTGADTMTGGSGDDLYVVDAGADRIVEAADGGVDSVEAGVTYLLAANVENLVLTGAEAINGYGNGSANRLIGNAAANRLDGGGAADRMEGGGGDDLYVVNHAGDAVVETADGGADTIEAWASYVMPDHVEQLVLLGSAAAGTGNGAANAITGTMAANVLNGGGGADTLRGLGGDDVYIVDAGADAVVETAEMGSDTVRSRVSYTLPEHVEALVLTGGGNLRGSGNGLANTITGNQGNNRLDGKAGADTMAGGDGHDVYVVNNPADLVVEEGSSGVDTVEAALSFTLPVHFEKLVLTGTFGFGGRGNAGDNVITGNAGANFLSGGSGDDVIAGGAGNDRILGGKGDDTLRGGAGADRFEFLTAPGAGNVDRILDFSAADDSLYLMRSAFAGVGPGGTLSASAFHAGAAAADADDRILYDAATGKIFFDADGSGATAAVLFAAIGAGTALTHADFMIYG